MDARQCDNAYCATVAGRALASRSWYVVHDAWYMRSFASRTSGVGKLIADGMYQYDIYHEVPTIGIAAWGSVSPVQFVSAT